ncbi:MAG TPA: HD domain-containing phosphohydrolase [Gemmataceae bacterium]|jgi:putative two-component system response regulator|nr:HD domain-containing phosphohydrolase [Gemmataceae bacterium]
MNILIVDDDDIVRSMLANTLEWAGYAVEVAADGREALEKLRTGSCRMVISDWTMPEMDGIELCRAVRGGDFPAYVYIILLTGRSGTQDIVDGLSAGADDFIAKPFQPAELSVRVRAGERILALETRDLAIFAMAKLAESRDPETGVHLDRMRRYSRLIAHHLSQQEAFRDRVTADYVRMIYLTSPLHDIGKIGIPDSVLLKPGRLSPREFEVMKKHTLIGAETLDAALRQHPGVEFLRMARDIALTHHEHYDGNGYPAGLAGEEIPLCGRIVALADVYDALIAKRVYKEAFSHDVARGILLEGAGSHFDPAVVDAFVQNEEKFVAIKEEFAEAEAVLV